MLSGLDLIEALSADLGALPSQLSLVIRTAPLRYKVFTIPKRDGSPRTVAQPAREVKAIQRWLVNDLMSVLPVHAAATAYQKGQSIKTNAEKHAKSNFILKMDFKNFFPSIEFQDIFEHVSKYASNRYDPSAVAMISRICTWAPDRRPPLRLCIGAPSSPLLSNSILYDFDLRVASYASDKGVSYTRYADDLTFSADSSQCLSDFPKAIDEIVARMSSPRLRVNVAKTVFASRAMRRMITGVTLTPDHELSVGRERKRLARAMFDHYLKGKLDAAAVEKMFGLLAFIDHIEPGFSENLKQRRGRDSSSES